jgi:hypothetical protein
MLFLSGGSAAGYCTRVCQMQATVVGVTLDGLCGVSGTKPGILYVELLACDDELRTDTNDLW